MRKLVEKVRELLSIHPNYGVTHAIINLVIMGIALVVGAGPYIVTSLGIILSAWWIYRETQGPEQYLPWYKRLIAYPDRIRDWVSPLMIAIVLMVISYV